MPADFGDQELVWTLTSRGKTERAYATLLVDYFIDDTVIMNNKGAGGAGGGAYNLDGNTSRPSSGSMVTRHERLPSASLSI